MDGTILTSVVAQSIRNNWTLELEFPETLMRELIKNEQIFEQKYVIKLYFTIAID